jgi:DNA-binding transcriptional LysR family regulator
MTLVQLRHLISLAETGSFSRSAEALFITQPALSRSIRSLEDELGQPLLDRIGWRSEPTAFGREVLARARRLVAEADELRAVAERLRTGATGQLQLGLGSGPAAILAVPLMRRMAVRFPAVHLDITVAPSAVLEEALRQRRVDALVIDARSVLPSTDLQIEPLGELRGAFMCRPGHPLTLHKSPLKFKDLLAYPMASIPLSDEVARVLVERYGPQAHPGQCVTLRCEEIPRLVEVVRETDAVLLSIRAAAPALVELTLSPSMNATARFGLATLAGRSEVPMMAELRALVDDLLHD